MRINHPTFHGSKVDEDPQGSINEVFIVWDDICMNPREKSKLDAELLKDVA